LQWHAAAAASTAPHCLDIWPVLQWLRKVADVAGDVLVAVHGEWYYRLFAARVQSAHIFIRHELCGFLGGTGIEEAYAAYNEAEGEPRVALDDVPAVVAAVVAPADDALVSLDFLPEGVLAAGEDETHLGRCWLQTVVSNSSVSTWLCGCVRRSLALRDVCRSRSDTKTLFVVGSRRVESLWLPCKRHGCGLGRN